MMIELELSVVCLIFLLTAVKAANWAQTSGPIKQNNVIPSYPSPGTPHWAARYGHVSIVVPLSNQSNLFILGGDTYQDTQTRDFLAPGLIDTTWENGYKNDVWKASTATADWSVLPNFRLKSSFGRRIPMTTSTLVWNEVQMGIHPPVGQTYDQFIACQPFFQNDNVGQISGANCSTTAAKEQSVQWSPRRHHAGIFFNGYLWIMGGRAREFVDLPNNQSIGGIQGPHVADIPITPLNVHQTYTTQRESIVYKSDVWKSVDGINWELVTPGCQAPQRSLIAKGNPVSGKYGISIKACKLDTDCYGAEMCDTTLHTCVCMMWSPREQLAIASYGDYMYVVGGYTSVLYNDFSACGDHPCGNTDASDYRYALADVWRSPDGLNWYRVTEKAFFDVNNPELFPMGPLGRGGHSMLAFTMNNQPFLWVFGGRGSQNSITANENQTALYYNDIWYSPLGGNEPIYWYPLTSLQSTGMPGSTGVNGSTNGQPNMTQPWSPRTGHSVCLEEASASNLGLRTLYLYGGYDGKETLSDMWIWRIDVANETWRQDGTSEELFTVGTVDTNTGVSTLQYYNNSPAIYYVSPLSNVSSLRRFWVPTNRQLKSKLGDRYQLRPYISSQEVNALNQVQIFTIQDLAEAGLYTILKLRGYYFPGTPASQMVPIVEHICDYRALAIAVVKKCTLTLPNLYDGEQQMPWNVIPVFGGAPPQSQNVKWHGRTNYNFLNTIDDPVTLLADWDGCTYESAIEGQFGPNVNGIGVVSQVTSIASPEYELENLFCSWTPGPRAWAQMQSFNGLTYLLGGKQSPSMFYADSWYRDANMPVTTITKKPVTATSDQIFEFVSNKPGVHFEVRLWDPENYKEIRGWNAVVKKAGIGWLNWRKGGPGTGIYQFYVRSIDPAGNSDAFFIVNQNVYEWFYVSPIPWDIIGSCTAAFITLCFFAYLEYRRRVKKAAMERYAMKRMRRKFKAMQRDIDGKAVDWRTLYLESKQAEEAGIKIDRKKVKKVRDKNAEKREKEKKRREKEKELIKKKLKANKELKDTKKVRDGGSVSSDNSNVPIAKGELIKSNVSTKPGGAGGKKSKIVPEAIREGDEGEEEGDYDEEKGEGKHRGGVIAKPLGGKKAPGSTKKIAPAEALSMSSKNEVSAGELLATKNTELGFKQRKVNKRYKSYETGGGAEEKDREEKDDNDEHKKAL